jgi:hypothetical protein
MSFEKENFLRTKLVHYLQQLDPATPARWGKMNVQQMIEHFITDGVMIASGRRKFEAIITPADHLRKLRDFLLSDRPFRENTKNPLLPEEPAPLQFRTVQAAIGSLHEELIYFFEAFERDQRLITRNPIFGDLDFVENVELLHKHARHHLHQFGVHPPDA